MKRENWLKIASSILGCGGLVGLVAPVQADSITCNLLNPVPYTQSTQTKTDWTGNLLFAQFNPALGDLESIDLQLSAELDTVLTVTNTASSSSSGSVKTQLQINVQDASGDLNPGETFDPLSGYAHAQLVLRTKSQRYTLASGTSTTLQQATQTGSYDSGSYDSTNPYWATVAPEFIGSGNISLADSTYTEALLANTGGNSQSSQVTFAGLTGTVTYTYSNDSGPGSSDSGSAVPEPATASVIVLSSAAAAGVLLRRSRRANQL